MPRYPDPRIQPAYKALEQWVDCALRRDDSLFTPGRPIWTAAGLDDLYRHFVLQPDETDTTFMPKFRGQLQGASPDTIQLAGELLYVHLITIYERAMSGAKKQAQIEEVLGWSSSPVPFPPSLVSTLEPGFVRDQWYLSSRPSQMAYLLTFMVKWKTLSPQERERRLADAWAFKDFVSTIPLEKAYGQREILLFYVFPDTFEAVTSRDHKRTIAERFADKVTEPTSDVDRKLLQIRAALTPQYGEGFHFYRPPLRELWQPPKSKPAPDPNPEPHPPGGKDDVTPEPPPSGTLAALASDLLLEEGYLANIERLLKDKGQVILYGPPGTGKTFVAKRLAQHLAGGADRVRIVQFHPSYAYEDFVEGFRPTDVNGAPGFKLVSGPLRLAADLARSDPNKPVILIIDELNRGNLAKVLGELYFLLEYRGEALSLQYSAEPFTLPPNLWFIGTMNTADRSIALLDAALRRRFYFVPFFPDEPPVKGLLSRWLQRYAPSMSWLADVVELANAQLGDRNVTIGPSYFMRPGLDEPTLSLVWAHAVRPYLEEQLFGDRGRLEQFELIKLRAKAAAAAAAPADGEGIEAP